MAKGSIPPAGVGGDGEWGRERHEMGEDGPIFRPEAREPLRVVGVAGSLRRGSFNRALLSATRELCPPELRIDIHELAGIPLFDEDLERSGTPDAVRRLREAVASADGFLVVTPEYNHGVPGVMKNAFDWLSRPYGKSALDGKPAAVMGATPGMTGTARAQTQLRQSFVFTNTPVLPQPEVLVARVHEKFDAEGRLTDGGTRTFVTAFLQQFVRWIERLRAPREAHV